MSPALTHTCCVNMVSIHEFYPARMSPALKESSTLEHFEHSNEIKKCNRIMFHFYPGLPQMVTVSIRQTHPHPILKQKKITINTAMGGVLTR